MDKPRSLLEDRFVIKSCDKSKFQNVARISGKSTAFGAEISVDVEVNSIAIAEGVTLSFGFYEVGMKPNMNTTTPALSSLMSQWDYVCYGKIFQEKEHSAALKAVYISFSGLLCCLIIDKSLAGEFLLNNRVFLMMRRI